MGGVILGGEVGGVCWSISIAREGVGLRLGSISVHSSNSSSKRENCGEVILSAGNNWERLFELAKRETSEG